MLTLRCRRSTHFWPKWWNLQPNEKEYVQLMKKRQWAIIYRLFGRGRTRETWPTLFPALVPIKSSLNFVQIKDPRKRSYRCMWEHLTTLFHSEGQIFDGVWQDLCHAYFIPPNGATLNQFLHNRCRKYNFSHNWKDLHSIYKNVTQTKQAIWYEGKLSRNLESGAIWQPLSLRRKIHRLFRRLWN